MALEMHTATVDLLVSPLLKNLALVVGVGGDDQPANGTPILRAMTAPIMSRSCRRDRETTGSAP